MREPVESQRQQGLWRDNYVFKGSLNGRVELRAGVDNALKGGPKGHAEPISGRVLAAESRQAGPGRFNPIVRAPVWKLGFVFWISKVGSGWLSFFEIFSRALQSAQPL